MTDANGDLLNAGARERLLCVLWDFDRFAQELTLPQRFDDQADWMRALITDSNDSDGGTGQPDLDQAIMAWLGEPARRARMVAWGWTDLALGSEPFILRFIVLQCLLRQLPDRLSDDFRNSLLFDLNLWVVSNPRVASGDDGEGSSERRESPFFNDEERAQVAFKRRMGAAWAHPVPRFDPEAALQLTDSLLAWRPGSPREPRLNLELVLASKLAAGWFPESEPTEVILGEQKYPARLCNERPGRPGKPPQGDSARWHFAARCMAIANFAGTALPDVDANTVPVVCFHKPDEMFGPEFTAHLDATTTLSSSRFGLWRTILINPLVTDSKLRGYTKEPESRLFIAWCCWHQSVDKRFREDVFLPLHAARHPAMTKGAR